MKKLFASLLVFSMVLVGCGGSGKDSSDKAEIVMITDKGTIDDKSFNQGTYEGVKEFAKENDITCNYIKPVDATVDDYNNAIDQAVKQGAKVVVTPGYLFEASIFEKQDEYPDVKFILIDGTPNKDGAYEEFKTAKNTIGIKYHEEQSGYLAGYAAVKDGHTKLGFMGGMAVPAVMSFGYGYIQGANDAANELGISIEMMYHYTGDFKATPDAQNMAASWYKDGVTIIFGCGGAVGNSVMAAAEVADPEGAVIGVDVDQSSESSTVITSAYKQLAVSVKDALAAIYNGDFDKTDDTSILFKGGSDIVLGASENAIGLPWESSKFKTFTEDDYKAIYDKIVKGEVTILNNTAAEDVSGVTAPNVTVTEVK